MGTSRNDASPDKGSWRLVRAIIGRPDYTPERQIQEIWRAAVTDRHELLFKELSTATLALASEFSQEGISVSDALDRYDNSSSQETHATLALEFGRRAIARCITSQVRTSNFAAELFSEATSYYLSRDLPSYVGAPGRIKSASEAISLKEAIRQATRRAVVRVGPPRKGQWSTYVERVIKSLQRISPQRKGRP